MRTARELPTLDRAAAGSVLLAMLIAGIAAFRSGEAAGVNSPKPDAAASPAPSTPAASALSAPPAANLLFTATTLGNASICGCRGARAGGLARRATVLRTWDASKEGPFAWVDGGDSLLFGSPQEIDISALILRTMEQLDCAAAVVGGDDLDNRVGSYERTIGASGLPFVSVNLRYHDTGERVFAPWRLIEIPRLAGGGAPAPPPVRIGLIGVSPRSVNRAAAGKDGRTIFATSGTDELAAILPEVRAVSDLVVVATALGSDPPESLLLGGPDVDVLLAGRANQSWAMPRLMGRTAVLVAGDRGREIIRVAIREADGRYRPSLSILPLTEALVPEDPAVAKEVGGVMDRLNEQSREIMTAWVRTHPPRPIAPWAGVMKCAECHAEEFAVWQKSGHAHAIKTLRDVKRDFTKACVYCHVTGWDSPDGGGFADPASTAVLNDVQCEACHGAGAAHAADPSTPYGAVAVPDGCTGCHDPANSAEFSYPVYWPRIAH